MNRPTPHLPHEGLLIVGHGTRDREGVAEFWSLVRSTAAACPRLEVQGCFLEFAEPSIAAGIAELVARGVDTVRVAPLLLFAAGHALEDIPAQVAQAAAEHRGLTTWQAPHLGCHPQLLKLSGRRFAESLSGLPARPAMETLLVMVGRGSHVPSAHAEMATFARLRFEAEAVGWMELGFMAMARPSLAEVLQMAARLPYPRAPYARVVVQPHLLFRGELWERVAAAVRAQAQEDRTREWIVTAPLGPEPELVQAVLARAGLAVGGGFGLGNDATVDADGVSMTHTGQIPGDGRLRAEQVGTRSGNE